VENTKMNVRVLNIVDKWARAKFEENLSFAFQTAHFNELGFEPSEGRALLWLALDIFNELRVAINKHAPNERYVPFIHIPLGRFEGIRPWSETLIDVLGKPKEPPSLYIVQPEHIYIHSIEEYRRPVEVATSVNGVVCVYKLSRSLQEMELEEEFEASICLCAEQRG
jgi:hypothetical protein